ncbi:MAG: hypothetical protein ACKOS8_10505, partial [Gemmataceae bacterium]
MEPACPLQAGQHNRRLLPLAWMAGLAGLLGVVGCGVNDYLDASRQTWSTLKQFDEDQKKLGGPAEIPVMERQVAQGTVKGPLLEICFRPPAGFNKAPTLLTQPNQPLKVLQYTSADGKASGGVAGWAGLLLGLNHSALSTPLVPAALRVVLSHTPSPKAKKGDLARSFFRGSEPRPGWTTNHMPAT